MPRRRGVTRQARHTLWAPLATFSSALLQRVAGLFFAMVATIMAGGAWRQRGAALDSLGASSRAQHLWLFIALAVLFGYFAVTSFLRASRRERRSL